MGQPGNSLTNAAGQGAPVLGGVPGVFGSGSIAQGRPSTPPQPAPSAGTAVAAAPDKGLDAGSFSAQFPMSTILASLLSGGIGGKGQQRHMGASPAFKGFEAPVSRNEPVV